jgi:hypothetical protein
VSLALLGVSAEAHAGSAQHARVAGRNVWASKRTSAAKPVRDPVALAASLAERYWGSVPCGGQVTVRAYAPLLGGLDPTTDGWATFASSLGPNDLAAPASSYTECTVSLARSQWPTSAAVRGDWNMFCLTVTHEFGHLLGHPHSLTPGSVMAPVFTDESSVPAICRASRAAVEAGARASG